MSAELKARRESAGKAWFVRMHKIARFLRQILLRSLHTGKI